MIINSSNLMAVFANLKLLYQNAFQGAATQYDKVAMTVPSTGKYNDYKWLGFFPRMREWLGTKVVTALQNYSYTIVNKPFEATIEISRDDLEDDQVGVYAPVAQMAGQSARQHPDELVFELLARGFELPCYDRQNFFDTDHPVMGLDGVERSVSNMFDKQLTCDTLAGAKASFGAALSAMKDMRGDNGMVLGISPNILVVPPALEPVANTLMTADRLEDGKVNIYKNAVTVVVVPWLSNFSRTAWFLIDATKAVRPLIYQPRKAATFVSRTDISSDRVFNEAMYEFGVESRENAGYGLWQLAYGSTGTGQ